MTKAAEKLGRPKVGGDPFGPLFSLVTKLCCFLALTLGSSAFAEAASAPCSSAGPSYSDTVNYLIKHVKKITAVSSDSSAGTAAFYIDGERIQIQFMNVDCERISSAKSVTGTIKAWVYCRRGVNCGVGDFSQMRHTTREGESDYALGDWTDYGKSVFVHDNGFYYGFETVDGDEAMTANLANALAHFFFLVQTDFHTEHGSNDPFAAK